VNASPARRSASSEEATCSIAGCTEPVHRSLARSEVRKAFPDLSEQGRRAALCRTHYKQYKKATREDRTFARLDW
jgi:hypothetical protein